MQEDKVVVWGGFTNSWIKKRNKKQGRKGKIYPNECTEFQSMAKKDKKAFLKDNAKK